MFGAVPLVQRDHRVLGELQRFRVIGFHGPIAHCDQKAAQRRFTPEPIGNLDVAAASIRARVQDGQTGTSRTASTLSAFRIATMSATTGSIRAGWVAP